MAVCIHLELAINQILFALTLETQRVFKKMYEPHRLSIFRTEAQECGQRSLIV